MHYASKCVFSSLIIKYGSVSIKLNIIHCILYDRAGKQYVSLKIVLVCTFNKALVFCFSEDRRDI